MAFAEFSLENIGNSCYLNAVLQAGFACQTLAQHLEALVCPLLVESPEVRADILTGLVQLLGFTLGQQEDAHECFQHWSRELPSSALAVLSGKTTREVSCGFCDCTSIKEQNFFGSFQCVVPEGSEVVSLEAVFVAAQSFEGFGFTCDICLDKRAVKGLPARKREFISVPPQTLVLHLKRFHRAAVKRAWSRKIRSPVEIVERLSVASVPYKLAAVVVHLGSSPYNGHYVTYRRFGDSWLLCNDESICEVPWAEVQRAARLDGYIYFFERVEELSVARTPSPRRSKRLAQP